MKVNPDPIKLRIMHDKDVERMIYFVDMPDQDTKGNFLSAPDAVPAK